MCLDKVKSFFKGFLWIGITIQGKYRLDLCSTFRILSNIVSTIILPLLDVISDIQVAGYFQWGENVAMELKRLNLLDTNEIQDLKQISNHLTSTIFNMVVIIPFLASSFLHVINCWKKWMVQKNPLAPLSVLLELPVVTGLAHFWRNIKTNLKIRYLELELKSQSDEKEVKKIKSILQRESLKILDWQIRCTMVEFYFESAPTICFLSCCIFKWGALPPGLTFAFVTSIVSCCTTASNIYLSYKSRTRPMLSHKFFSVIPCGVLAIAKLFSLAIIICLVANICHVQFQYIFLALYIGHFLIMVSL